MKVIGVVAYDVYFKFCEYDRFLTVQYAHMLEKRPEDYASSLEGKTSEPQAVKEDN